MRGFLLTVLLVGLSGGAYAQEVPPQPMALFSYDPNTDFTTSRPFPTTSTGTHANGRVGAHFSMVTEGSGVNFSPAKADYAFIASTQKRNFLSNDAAGEINGIYVVTRQGTGDNAAILANAAGRVGSQEAFEGSGSLINSEGTPVLGTRTVLGTANRVYTGTGTNANAVVAYAAYGAATSAFLVTADANASWIDALQVHEGDTAPLRAVLKGNGNRLDLG